MHDDSSMSEKNGLSAVLFWLNILAARRLSVMGVFEEHWRIYGRHFYTRYDYEALDPVIANALVSDLRQRLRLLPGQLAGRRVIDADDYQYSDPVDGSLAVQRGLRVLLDDEARIVFRLSGTGTEGATLRVYASIRTEPRTARDGYARGTARSNGRGA